MKTFVLLLALTAALHAETVDDVIARNIQAHGGLDKLRAIHSLRVKGRVGSNANKVSFVDLNERPDKVRHETHIQGFVEITAYDGHTGWKVSPFEGRKTPDLVSEDDLKNLREDADIDGPLVDYQAKGHTAELLGHDDVEGTDCWKVKLTLKDGNARIYYFDTASGLEIKMDTQNLVRGTLQESEVWFGDYEARNGVYFPFAVEAGQKGSQDRTHMTVDDVDVNPKLDDALFSLPK
jgi:hypothetical protein